MNTINKVIMDYYHRCSDLTIQELILKKTGEKISPEQIQLRYDILTSEAK